MPYYNSPFPAKLLLYFQKNLKNFLKKKNGRKKQCSSGRKAVFTG